MLRFFKEIYLTAFTIFFRFCNGAWSPETNAGKSVTVIALIEEAFILGVVSWLDVLVGTRSFLNIPKWVIAVAFLALWVANQYLLVVLGHGIIFEREFTHFNKSKKIRLLTSCVAIIVGIVSFFVYSVSVFHQFFYIIPKSRPNWPF